MINNLMCGARTACRVHRVRAWLNVLDHASQLRISCHRSLRQCTYATTADRFYGILNIPTSLAQAKLASSGKCDNADQSAHEQSRNHL